MEREEIATLYKKYGLSKDDVYKDYQYIIITRSGIEKIMEAENIRISYSEPYISDNQVIIKATPFKGDKSGDSTYGEWNRSHVKKKKDGSGDVPYYAAALAEKRAKSRAVLMFLNLYQEGLMGEDEDRYDDDATRGQKNRIDVLLRTCTFDEDYMQEIEKDLKDMKYNDANRVIDDLKNNQRDPIQSGDNYSAGDILKSI